MQTANPIVEAVAVMTVAAAVWPLEMRFPPSRIGSLDHKKELEEDEKAAQEIADIADHLGAFA
jgi:hypothetical protein